MIKFLLRSVVHTDKSGVKLSVEELIRATAVLGESSSLVSPRMGNQLLCDCGVKILRQDGKFFLAIANYHKKLDDLFAGTQWALDEWLGAPIRQGGWRRAARQITGAEAGTPLRFGGVLRRSTWIPLEAILGFAHKEFSRG